MTKKDVKKRAYMRTDIVNLCNQAVREINVPGYTIGIAIAVSFLEKITDRVIELDDKLLLSFLYQLNLIKPESKEEEQELLATLHEHMEAKLNEEDK